MNQSTAARPVARAATPRVATPRGAAAPRAAGPRPAAPQNPRLRVVTAPRHTRSRAGLVAVCVALLVLGLVGLLLLNVSLERGTYDLRDQELKAQQLREREQLLEDQLRGLQAPAELAKRAGQLGYVPAQGSWAYLVGGKRVGAAVPAPTPTPSTVTPSPSPSAPKATPSVKASPSTEAAADR
jgi:hypothetical protein